MDNSLEKMMLPFKLQQLLDIIIEKRRLYIKDALHYLFSSELYKQLSSKDSGLWQLSALNLYDLLKKEKRALKHSQNGSVSVLLFLSFCIENYKVQKAIDAEEVLFLFTKHHVIEYLTDFYDTLHTQSREYIIGEIDNYIENGTQRP